MPRLVARGDRGEDLVRARVRVRVRVRVGVRVRVRVRVRVGVRAIAVKTCCGEETSQYCSPSTKTPSLALSRRRRSCPAALPCPSLRGSRSLIVSLYTSRYASCSRAAGRLDRCARMRSTAFSALPYVSGGARLRSRSTCSAGGPGLTTTPSSGAPLLQMAG